MGCDAYGTISVEYFVPLDQIARHDATICYRSGYCCDEKYLKLKGFTLHRANNRKRYQALIASSMRQCKDICSLVLGYLPDMGKHLYKMETVYRHPCYQYEDYAVRFVARMNQDFGYSKACIHLDEGFSIPSEFTDYIQKYDILRYDLCIEPLITKVFIIKDWHWR